MKLNWKEMKKLFKMLDRSLGKLNKVLLNQKRLKLCSWPSFFAFSYFARSDYLSELSSGKELYREEAKNLLLATEQKT